MPILGGGFQLDLSSISLRGLYAAVLTELGAALGESVLARIGVDDAAVGRLRRRLLAA